VSAGAVKEFLSRHSLLARRDLGQNFLIDDALAARLVDLAGVEAGDWVIEIGTGLGSLTQPLAARAERVLSFEIDAGIVRALREDAVLPENVELVHADALEYDLAQRVVDCGRPVRLVANLPYNVSAPMLRRILDLREVLVDWSVMLQSEVARRLLASAGTRDYSSLSVLHRMAVKFSHVMELSPNCFFPVPGVHSTFVRIAPLASPLVVGRQELAEVERVVRAAFSKRRKTLVNSLRAGGLGAGYTAEALRAVLVKIGLDVSVRAERLDPGQLLALTRALRSLK
jgi:16S rRNA (adenine1518-N6/adenine1519-N6)-dimethyltransferase